MKNIVVWNTVVGDNVKFKMSTGSKILGTFLDENGEDVVISVWTTDTEEVATFDNDIVECTFYIVGTHEEREVPDNVEYVGTIGDSKHVFVSRDYEWYKKEEF